MRTDGESASPGDNGHERDLIAYAQAQTQRAKKVGPGPALDGSLPRPDLLPGHVILEEVHRGGQGVVYKAMQSGTRREVAVKVLRDGVFAGPTERARFDREVEILAQLRHPNIVGIHLGGSVDGHRYFVMDYIEGRPLDAYVTGADHSIREILTLFLKICEAIGAAHLRGVLHRDLKPSNIRVDADGEPHILDFGLAKWSDGRADRAASRRCATATGAFVGSLPWCAPEQAEGRSDRIDIRTDVYALGVMLFQMLTGRFPYSILGSPGQVLDTIQHAEPKRPSTLRRDVTNELDTIVLKCLAKNPARRYQSAGELARDVKRYLAGRPIEAKRDSAWYVLTKTVRRHRKLMVGLGVLLLLTLGYAVSLTVLYRQVVAAERRAVQSGQRAQSHAADAREKFRLATDALGFVVTEVSDQLRDVSGASGARRTILEGAFKKLQALTVGHTDDLLLQVQIARAYLQLGDIAVSLGEVDQAAEQFQAALALRQRFVEADEGNEGFLVDLSMSLVRVGDVTHARRDVDGARKFYEQALSIDRKLASQHPKSNHYRDNLAWSYDRLGALAQQRNDLELSREYHQKQYAIMKDLVAAEPNNAVRVYGLYTACKHLQELAGLVGDWRELAEHIPMKVELAERMTSLEPANPLYARRLVDAYLVAGWFAEMLKQPEAAVEQARKALVIAERLVAADPNVLENRFALANALGAVTRLGVENGEDDKIGDYGSRWYVLTEELAADTTYDFDPKGQERVFYAAKTMAEIARRQGRDDDARRYLKRALSVGAQAVKEPHPSAALLSEYADMLAHVTIPDLRDPSTAVAAAQRALAIAGELPERLLTLGKVYCATGDPDQGMNALRRALSKLSPDATPFHRSIEEAMRACSGEANAPDR